MGKYYFFILLLVPILISISINDVFAASTTVDVPTGTSVPGCEQTNSCFLPSSVSINVGDTVTWYNSDTAAHTVTSGTGTPDGTFDSSLFMSGSSYSVTFTQSGTYPYFCMVHPWMQGVVNVQGAPSIEYYSIQVSVSPSTVLEDEVAVISGQLYASQYISGYEVSVQFETDTGLSGGGWVLDGGQFNVNVVWPVGVHTITYYFDTGSGTLVSNSITLTVKTPDLPGTIITLDPFTSSITGGKVSFSGQLISENGLAISGKMVFVQAESGGSGQSLSAITDSNGRFTAELNFGTENKVWTIYAKFEGDSEYKKSSSNIRQLTVTSAPTPPPPAPPGTDVVIALGSSVPGCEQTNSCYSPSTISVDVGDTVTWYNADTAAHTVVSGTAANGPDGVFDSSLFMSGTSFSHTFFQAGTYPYFDMTQPWIAGVVIVEAVLVEFLPSISVSTSSSTYDEGDTIVISGKVINNQPGKPVTIQILNAGNLVAIVQLDLASNGIFIHTILAEGQLWNVDGTYQVRASYENVIDETYFILNMKVKADTFSGFFEVDAGSAGTYDVSYSISYGTIQSILLDQSTFSLIITLNTNADGNVVLSIPRELLDAKKANGSDDVYIALINGREVAYTETISSSSFRSLSIGFEQGDNEIEIIGTKIATTPEPEF